ncbi:hypothetical protein UFOVP1492_55 [uncultured Caudovirales phage]|uniref:Uncharacterized protein n=1 Tax=uncultured Caudovirales phage TaxID=2100421 RepID=A0A6J5SRA3_9CAUD|nr:hypothetical protein UFOVP1127_79 [uncultured Caudovirales phage]CAB4193697.1 hypothetical protein UFOVP1242_131 [uncultured Caudovirales phage]CAB4217646.1 hypothetical protein UFOVP1492_55 [uncultured Caudovirales phage]CAB5231452.1 hypothetical protein UFOVP1580_84 [uncultured Caudovirales phage]
MGRTVKLVIKTGTTVESTIWENEFDGPAMLELARTKGYFAGVVAAWWGWTATELAKELEGIESLGLSNQEFISALVNLRVACETYDLCTIKTYL